MTSRVIKNSMYYMVATFLPTAVGFLMLPIYTRYLTPIDYGVVSLVLIFQSFLPLIMTLQIDSSISRFYFDYKDYELKVFVSTIFIVVLLLSLFMTGTLFFFLDNLLSFIFPKTIGYNNLFLLGGGAAFFSVFKNICVKLIRVQQKARLFMKISLCLFCVSLVINILEVIVLHRGAYGVIESAFISSLLSTFVYFIFTKEFFIFRFDKEKIIEPLKYSLPLIPHSISGLIFMYSDRIVLEKYVSLSIIGIYMFSDKIATVFKILVNEFNAAFLPRFNEISKESKDMAIKETQEIALPFVYLVCMLVTFLSVFSTEIVTFLFSDKYYNSWIVIPLLSYAYIFRALYCFSVCGLFFNKKTGKVTLITLTAGLANIILNILLIPKYGMIAAVYTTIFSFFLTFVMSIVLSYKIYYINLGLKKQFTLIAYVSLAMIVSILINNHYPHITMMEYFYKILILLVGCWVGFKMKLIQLRELRG